MIETLQTESRQTKTGNDDPTQLNTLAMASEKRFDALDLLKNNVVTPSDIDRDLKRTDLTTNDRLVDTFLKDNFGILTSFEPYKSSQTDSSALTTDELHTLEIVTTPGEIKRLENSKATKAGYLAELAIDGPLIAVMFTAGLAFPLAPASLPIFIACTLGGLPAGVGGAMLAASHARKAFEGESNYYKIKQQQALQMTLPTNQ